MQMSLTVNVLQQNGLLVITNQEGQTVTFNKDQVVQKKVCMVAIGELGNYPKLQVAQAFGFKGRKSYYDARDVVLNGQTADLLPQQTGPKSATKRTRELEALVIQMRFESDMNMYKIADTLVDLGFDVSARLVGQILSDFGLAKKKRF